MEQKAEPPLVPAVQRAAHTLGLRIEQRLHDVGVTQAEAHVLAYLAGHETCAINDLHRSFGHRRSTLTSVLDRIEGRGLARRGPHPTSRRSVMVHLTPEGRQIAHRVAAELSAIDAAVTAHTGREDLAAFMRVIDAIEEAVHD